MFINMDPVFYNVNLKRKWCPSKKETYIERISYFLKNTNQFAHS